MTDSITHHYRWATQSVPLSSVINARELGGYVLPDGSRIRRGLLLRGGSLAQLSDEDRARFADGYSLRYVFDFRTEGETRHAPDRDVPGARYVWLPAIDPETEKLGTTILPREAYADLPGFLVRHASTPLVQDVARRLYTDMVTNEYTQLQYSAFLQMIAGLDDGAVFWHCSQGKDRTGLGAAFLLAALGADRDLIMADFAISNEYYRAEVEMLSEVLLRQGAGKAELDVVRTFVGVNTDYFAAALDLIDSTYGSMDDFLRNQLLLSDEDRIRMRYRLLEPPL